MLQSCSCRSCAICLCVLQEAKKQRLRRICERKPSGRINVPQEIHEQWLKGDRDGLLQHLEAAGFKKAGYCVAT